MTNKQKLRFIYFVILIAILCLFCMVFKKRGNPRVIGSRRSITVKHFLYLDILINCYVEDNGILPSVGELQKYVTSIKNGSFAGEEALLDEWGNKIIYVILSTNSYELISIGNDRKMNTDDDLILRQSVPEGPTRVSVWLSGSEYQEKCKDKF